MAGVLTTLTLNDKNGAAFTQRVWDESGTGVGPFQPVMVIASSAGVVEDLGAKLDTLATDIVNGMLPLGVGAASTGARVVNAFQATGVVVTDTRPANATAYTANDNVGGALTFANFAPAACEMEIVSAALEIDVAAIPSGMTTFRLYLYSVTPPSALADNAAWDLPSGDRASFLGVVPLGSIVDLGSTLYCEVNNIGKRISVAGTSVFGYLVTDGGFTPAGNSEVYKITLHAEPR